MQLKKRYKAIVPKTIRDLFSRYIYRLFIVLSPVKSRFLLKKLKKKNEIEIVLFMHNVDSWKLHSLYQEFDKNIRFKPIVVICPMTTKGDELLHEKLDASKKFCVENDYNHYVAYDYEKSKVINIREKLVCDIVFFTNPNQFAGENLYIDNFDDCLTCYVPYSFRIDTLYEYEYNNRTVNKVWKCFYETNFHKQLAEEYADNKGRNVEALGFPYLDTIKKTDVSRNDERKLIIWAPHWTIKGAQNTGLDWACFLDYYDFVLELAEKYKDKISFAMKPHPFLFDTLKQDSVWGKEKVERYIDRWKRAENCWIETGDYIDLFNKSDALIHDGGSFMTEYLLQDKPMAYAFNVEDLSGRFNLWGDEVLKSHCLIKSKEGLQMFIEDIISSKDIKSKVREKLIFENQFEDHHKVSIKIINYIENCII